ncbi:Uncharacterized protein DBV15_00564 [Temnothorax longispinosus]|uniref:Uncharacterized protein n=1 Tax=Temnothorax longispinosus TaxID=300112 RepID=A0A4V3SBI4_9HYME|nr:Uncharacterized protein DBV15_00564 [Temnothorax longispinosus]
MFDLRRYGYLVASLINRECIEISETASSDVVCAPRATCRDETASVNSRELQGFRQAEAEGSESSARERERKGTEGGKCRYRVSAIVHSVVPRIKADADRAKRTFVIPPSPRYP